MYETVEMFGRVVGPALLPLLLWWKVWGWVWTERDRPPAKLPIARVVRR